MRDMKEVLERIIMRPAHRLTQHPFLDSLEEARTVGRVAWQEVFAPQRYLAGCAFVHLLNRAIDRALDEGMTNVALDLQYNLDDEEGYTQDAKEPVADMVHEQWRIWFYTALGIDERKLKSTPPLTGTMTYLGAIEYLLHFGTACQIAGAIMLLELQIPLEFLRVQKARDRLFPEKFVINPDDDEETRAAKERARRYIDDHIDHDLYYHLPGLIEALGQYIKTPQNLAEVRSGVRLICRAKQHFYTGLKRRLVDNM